MFLLITIKSSVKNPEHPHSLKCRHERYMNTQHCAEMVCANYIMSCQRHGYNNQEKKCSRQKRTAPCPLTNATCTDQTGEHHTGLYLEYDSIDAAEIDFKNLGYHVTRIEEVSLPDGWRLVQDYDAKAL